MLEESIEFNKDNLRDWRSKIEEANRNNIFCHCRTCDEEWVDSFSDAPCYKCGSNDVEHIPCWQFPDD